MHSLFILGNLQIQDITLLIQEIFHRISRVKSGLDLTICLLKIILQKI